MVITKISYGLANQMFQYAAGRALAARNNQLFKLDLSFFDNALKKDDRPTHEFYQLSIFKGTIKHQSLDNEYLERLINKYKHNIAYRFLNKFSKQVLPKPLFTYCWEKDFLKFDYGINKSSGKTIYLNGYFQNERYFEDAKALIKEDFTFREDLIDPVNLNLGIQMGQENSVSIHVRRGDYVGKRFIPSLGYYKNAIELIIHTVNDPVFYIFSDDSEWAAKHVKAPGQVHYIVHNTQENSYKDMYLMSKCMHNIIANSSFSWWGAWLNSNENKVVISPKQWLPEDNVLSADIIPSNWLQVEAQTPLQIG